MPSEADNTRLLAQRSWADGEGILITKQYYFSSNVYGTHDIPYSIPWDICDPGRPPLTCFDSHANKDSISEICMWLIDSWKEQFHKSTCTRKLMFEQEKTVENTRRLMLFKRMTAEEYGSRRRCGVDYVIIMVNGMQWQLLELDWQQYFRFFAFSQNREIFRRNISRFRLQIST